MTAPHGATLDPSGVLLIDKPGGMTSHDVVDAVRRKHGWKKVGHAGTLDPMATGVLVLLVGKATRAQARFLNDDKGYRGTMRLGEATTTHDREGEVTHRSDPPVEVTEDRLREAFQSFLGEIEQVPPIYSAVKHKGRPLYKYARQGVEVEREARKVTIRELKLLSFDGRDASFDVSCSKGTYVRTLAHDIGLRLGTYAHLVALRRTRSGPFREEHLHPLDRVLAARREEVLYLLQLLSELPAEGGAPA